ncbi:hypothetical protein B0H14DRAFT_3546477, partial [Mycena olivaceomarginata]
ATSLAGVLILRPFQKKVIQRHPRQDVRSEFQRLDMLCHQTIMLHGTPDEAAAAQEYLVSAFSSDALPSVDEVPDTWLDGNGGARRLGLLQATNGRLIAGSMAASESSGLHRTTVSPATSRVRIQLDNAPTQTQSSRSKRPGDTREDVERPLPKRARITQI